MTERTSDAAQALAEAVADSMWSRDRATQALGMRIEAIRPGYARISMPVREDMLNGHRICHGGLIFTLADSAFAYACNSYNKNTVASACHIDFLAPGREGDTLQAEAVEQSASGRTGVYDVTVRDGEGRTLALFRGKSYRISGDVIDNRE
ncbi:MAG: hydroxyphenylacetyl-CoA thioesterase PaaI [Proteobacteria bacterium]|nr:hydroxyphenylacetyl-CoA thioesterase PaaI [Pseudomonadota bacterium]